MPDFNLPIEKVKEVFPHFTALEPLPGGGQKLVYRVTDATGSQFALKILKRDGGVQDERALREIRAAGALDADFFPQITEARYCKIDDSDYICILEEYIDGQSLAQILKVGPQSLHMIRVVGTALLDALTYVERASLVHRDIKPGNVMITDTERVILIDFGIARHLDRKSLTSSYALFGPMTVGYCAPEQILNQKRQISIRTDLFAVGVLLYEMALGVNPFVDGCSSPQEALERCLQFEPSSLATHGFCRGLSDFVDSCMAKASHRRPHSAQIAYDAFVGLEWEEKL